MNFEWRIGDCWNRIGVYGDQSCPELPPVIHCRNCEVYVSAARVLLERMPSDSYLQQWTQLIQDAKAENPSPSISIVIFRLETEQFALPTQVIHHITDLRTVHRLPHNKSECLTGLVNVQGELLLCISLSKVLPYGQTTDEESTSSHRIPPRLMVIQAGGERWVLPVNEIFGMYQLHPADIEYDSDELSLSEPSLVKGTFRWKNGNVHLLDEAQLFKYLKRSVH